MKVKMKILRYVQKQNWFNALAVAVLALPLAGYSVTVTQTVDSASSSSDWNTALWGDPADIPAGGTDYISAPGLRSATPTRIGAGDASAFVRFYASSSPFAGDSLTLVDGTELLLKQTANETAEANIILDGGSLRLSAGTDALGSVTGTLHVASESWIGVADLGSPVLTVGSTITGTNLLHVGVGLSDGTVIFSGDLSGFTGTLEVGGGDTAGTVDFGQSAALSAMVLGLTKGSADKINLTGNMTFLACNVGTNSLPIGTYTAAEANETLFLATDNFVDNGGSITVLTAPYDAPEPPPAGIVYQTAIAGSSDSWNGPAIWGGSATISTNNYISSKTSGYSANQINYNILGRIRALSTDALFDGKSLTMVADTELLMKATGGFTSTCDDLILQGGLIRYAPNSASLATLAGGLTVATNSVIGMDNPSTCTLTIASSLHGSGNLSLRAGRVAHILAFDGDLSDYTGDFNIEGGRSALILDLNQNYDLPDLDMFMEESTNRVHVLQLDNQTIKLKSFTFGTNSLAKGTAYTAEQLDAYFGTTGQFTGSSGTLEVYNSGSVVPTLDPDIISFSVAGGSASLTWISEAGVTYSILHRTNLTMDDWTPVQTNIVATSTNTTDSVTVSGTGQEFFQIKSE